MMLHLDANGFLQTAILSGDRQAVEAGARVRAQLASTELRPNPRNHGSASEGRARPGTEAATVEAACKLRYPAGQTDTQHKRRAPGQTHPHS
eukprot:6472282-Pyramimonas_sp.AAC.1